MTFFSLCRSSAPARRGATATAEWALFRWSDLWLTYRTAFYFQGRTSGAPVSSAINRRWDGPRTPPRSHSPWLLIDHRSVSRSGDRGNQGLSHGRVGFGEALASVTLPSFATLALG